MATSGSGGAQQAGFARLSYWLLLLAITVSCLAAAAVTRQATEPKQPTRYRFAPSTVMEMAQKLSEQEL